MVGPCIAGLPGEFFLQPDSGVPVVPLFPVDVSDGKGDLGHFGSNAQRSLKLFDGLISLELGFISNAHQSVQECRIWEPLIQLSKCGLGFMNLAEFSVAFNYHEKYLLALFGV